MNRKIGSIYLFFAILTLIGKTMEGRVRITVNINETSGYSYFRDHYCSGIFFDVWASDYVSAKVKCNNMQGCGCIGILDAREYNGDCETAKGEFTIWEGSEIHSYSKDFPDGKDERCAWVKS